MRFKLLTASESLSSILKTLFVDYHFDGIEIDWLEFSQIDLESIGSGNIRNSIKDVDKKKSQILLRLLEIVKQAIARLVQETFHIRLAPLLCLKLSANSVLLSSSPFNFHIRDIARMVNWINLMTVEYNLGSKLEPYTSFIAPLHPMFIVHKDYKFLSVSSSINQLQTLGIDMSKIVIGLAAYGRSYELDEFPKTYISSTMSIKNRLGVLSQSDICTRLNDKQNIKKSFDLQCQVPFFTHKNVWVTYENRRSIEEKVRLVVKKRLGGVFVWNINLDSGQCFEDSTNSVVNFKVNFHMHKIVYESLVRLCKNLL